ncbi:MAG TPA: hypothetical protein PKX16_09220, partial [Kiritimatiellia bacterium]|nr:hypothetical protein [Kiritimatiellia bacterium]
MRLRRPMAAWLAGAGVAGWLSAGLAQEEAAPPPPAPSTSATAVESGPQVHFNFEQADIRLVTQIV